MKELREKHKVLPRARLNEVPVKAHFSRDRYYVKTLTSESEPLGDLETWNGKPTRVWKYKFSPKRVAELRTVDENMDPGKFDGEIWLDVKTCKPLQMVGKYITGNKYTVDKVSIKYAHFESGYYPEEFKARSRIHSRALKVLSWAASRGQGVYKNTELTISYKDRPQLTVVQRELLEQNNVPVPAVQENRLGQIESSASAIR